MASVSHDRNGTKRVQFIGKGGIRKTIRLGKVSIKLAEAVACKVQALASAARARLPWDSETAAWVAGIDDTLYAKLQAVGLVPPRDPLTAVPRLGPFLQAYIDGRTDVKPQTIVNLRHAMDSLVRFFGPDRPLTTITQGDAEEYRRFLLQRLAPNTARRHCARAKQFFAFAVRKEYLDRNPFDVLRGLTLQSSPPERMAFVSRETAAKVMEACPDAQWRLLFALARFGGLRTPSEPLALRWGDVDWERERITIHSPKTAHHEGKGTRQIPIFPELRGPLSEVFDQAPPGTEYVITRYRDSAVNLRTQLQRIIQRAGLTPWPKLWQNLRSTRETELAQQYPIHVVCYWLGNSTLIAKKHYLQVRDEDFRLAANATNPGDSSAHTGGKRPENGQGQTPVSLPENHPQPVAKTEVESAPPSGAKSGALGRDFGAQNPAQTAEAGCCQGVKLDTKDLLVSILRQPLSSDCLSCQNTPAPRA